MVPKTKIKEVIRKSFFKQEIIEWILHNNSLAFESMASRLFLCCPINRLNAETPESFLLNKPNSFYKTKKILMFKKSSQRGESEKESSSFERNSQDSGKPIKRPKSGGPSSRKYKKSPEAKGEQGLEKNQKSQKTSQVE